MIISRDIAFPKIVDVKVNIIIIIEKTNKTNKNNIHNP